MRKTLAAVTAGLLIVAAAPAFAGGGCGSYIQSVEGQSGGHSRVAQSDQVSTPTTQTATTEGVTQ